MANVLLNARHESKPDEQCDDALFVQEIRPRAGCFVFATAIPLTSSIFLPESIAAHPKTSSKSLVCATNGNAVVKVVGGAFVSGGKDRHGSVHENLKRTHAATSAWRHRTIRAGQREKFEAKIRQISCGFAQACVAARAVRRKPVFGWFFSLRSFCQGQIMSSTAK